MSLKSTTKTGILLLLLPLFALAQQNDPPTAYPAMVGDISFDPKTDKTDFQLCYKQIAQYFNYGDGLEYEGEKAAIEKEFSNKYQPEMLKNETGLIRIRFVVNCKGETDRFRLMGMDENYNEKEFPASITEQLLNITKNLKGWKIKKYKEYPIDYYQYLIFKIENGQLKEILP